jgi:hypothetical protein
MHPTAQIRGRRVCAGLTGICVLVLFAIGHAMALTLSGMSAPRRLAAGLVLAAAVALASTAARAVVTFEYSSTCDFFCAGAGLSFGDAVTGTVVLTDAVANTPDAPIGNADLVSFSFDFGSVHVDSSTAVAFTLIAAMDAVADVFGFFVLVAGTTFDPVLGDGFALGGDWRASEGSFCVTASCDSLSQESPIAQGLVGSFIRVRETQVQEPAALLLLLPPLAWLARAAGRRRRGAS